MWSVFFLQKHRIHLLLSITISVRLKHFLEIDHSKPSPPNAIKKRQQNKNTFMKDHNQKNFEKKQPIYGSFFRTSG